MKYSIIILLLLSFYIIISCNKDNDDIQLKKEISITSFTADDSNLRYTSIRNLSVDQEGKKWYVARDGNQYVLYGFENEPIDSILKIPLGVSHVQGGGCYYCWSEITMFNFDSNNNLWISYDAYNHQGFTNWEKDELRVRRNGEWKRVDSKPNSFKKINRMVEERENDYWFSGPNGIGHYKDGQWTIFNKDNSAMKNNYITDILIDEEKTKWISSYGGLIQIKGEEMKVFTSENTSLLNDTISGLTLDTNDELLVYSANELLGIENADFSSKLSLPYYDSDFQIIVDNNHIMWMTGRFDEAMKGLLNYDGKVWEMVFNMGLDLAIRRAIVDKENRIWIPTSEGLIKVEY